MRALFRAAPRDERGARASGVPDPATFTLPARVPAFSRARQAWHDTDYQARLERMIHAPRLRRCVTIAVVSPKGGVGKSTTTALLGSLLAFLRRDRVVAVDTNNDWGSLGRRLVPDHPVFIDELLAGPLAGGQLPPTELDVQLGRGPDGLMVAPAPTDPERAEQLDEGAYRTLFTRFGELVGMLVLDCGTGLGDPPARAALSCADQLVLVADCEPDTASLVSEAAAWLEQHRPAAGAGRQQAGALLTPRRRRARARDRVRARARHRADRPRRRPPAPGQPVLLERGTRQLEAPGARACGPDHRRLATPRHRSLNAETTGALMVLTDPIVPMPRGTPLSVCLVALLVWLALSVVALIVSRKRSGPVLAINLLLGWTLIGWALRRAIALNRRRSTGLLRHRNAHDQSEPRVSTFDRDPKASEAQRRR